MSSEPPMWRVPMNICGTVLRPLRRIISSRSSGCDSMSISRKLTPLDLSNARARSQYGHHDLVYMTTCDVDMLRAAPCPSIARQRQVLGTPGGDPASKIEHFGETLLGERAHGGRCARAPVAIENQRLPFISLESVGGIGQLTQVEMPRATDMPLAVLLLCAHVEQRGALVHQADHILRTQGRKAQRPQAQLVDQHSNAGRDGRCREPGVVSGVFEQLIHGV